MLPIGRSLPPSFSYPDLTASPLWREYTRRTEDEELKFLTLKLRSLAILKGSRYFFKYVSHGSFSLKKKQQTLKAQLLMKFMHFHYKKKPLVSVGMLQFPQNQIEFTFTHQQKHS